MLGTKKWGAWSLVSDVSTVAVIATACDFSEQSSEKQPWVRSFITKLMCSRTVWNTTMVFNLTRSNDHWQYWRIVWVELHPYLFYLEAPNLVVLSIIYLDGVFSGYWLLMRETFFERNWICVICTLCPSFTVTLLRIQLALLLLTLPTVLRIFSVLNLTLVSFDKNACVILLKLKLDHLK